MHCKALGGKIMIPGRLIWEKVKSGGHHKSRFVDCSMPWQTKKSICHFVHDASVMFSNSNLPSNHSIKTHT